MENEAVFSLSMMLVVKAKNLLVLVVICGTLHPICLHEHSRKQFFSAYSAGRKEELPSDLWVPMGEEGGCGRGGFGGRYIN